MTSDKLEGLDLAQLRAECIRRGIHYPCGNPLHAACIHELLDALRDPANAEAQRLGLLTPDD